MKVQASVKKRCARCKIIKRGKYLRVICKAKRSHQQRQG